MSSQYKPTLRRAFAALAGALVMCLLASLLSTQLPGTAESAEAAEGSAFDPGYIISDAQFFDGGALNAAGVQAFLDARVPTCRASTGPTCLRHYSADVPYRAAEAGRCNAIAAAGTQSAARILEVVGQACGISQKSLIVLLEKEQALVSSTAPTTRMYRSATGYGCPDTADCDTAYYGFFNQVYMAALQFKRYAANPTGWRYRAGQDNAILYHPNAACGSKNVYIRNQATAGLYIYTPYTPNAAALANLYGTGDGCSSYGNRNFWRIFTDWFGSPTGNSSPSGAVTGAGGGWQRIVVHGYVRDPDTTEAVTVHVYVDGRGMAIERGNLSEQRFSATILGIAPGPHQVCAYGINVGPGTNTLLGCNRVTVPSGSPLGGFETAEAGPGTITVSGWVLDPDSTASGSVHVYVDGVGRGAIRAGASYPNVDVVYPGYGTHHGYRGTITGISPGTHQVCVYGIDHAPPGSNSHIACRTVDVPAGSPRGEVVGLQTGVGAMRVYGWAIDPETTAPLDVHVYVDGVGRSITKADRAAPALPTAYRGFGANHGFDTRFGGIGPGSHNVCTYAINIAGPGTNPPIDCRTVTMQKGLPVGTMSATVDRLGRISVSGWTVDPDDVAALQVHLYVDGVGAAIVSANRTTTAMPWELSAWGDRHGFEATLSRGAPGDHTVCAYAINLRDGVGNQVLGCHTVPVPEGSPIGALDQARPVAPGQVTVTGWAIDPDTTSPIDVHVYVDGVGRAISRASLERPDVGAAFPGYGNAHGYSADVGGLSPGTHTICTYGIQTAGSGSNTHLGCLQATVQ